MTQHLTLEDMWTIIEHDPANSQSDDLSSSKVILYFFVSLEQTT